MKPFEVTSDTYLRSFQYKFITRIIPTNVFLYKCKIKSSNICDFCSSYNETFEYLFWECRFVQILWNELTKLFQRNKINVKLHLKEICLGSF